jgi:hypothetical protein
MYSLMVTKAILLSLHNVEYFLVPAQTIMLFFYMEMLSETTSAYLLTSKQYRITGNFTVVILALAGPLIIFVLGLIPAFQKIPSKVPIHVVIFRIKTESPSTSQQVYRGCQRSCSLS